MERTVNEVKRRASLARWGDQETRLWSDVRVESPGCWLWTGGTRNGYGRTSWDGRRDYVHRVVWRLLVGPIPDGLELDHLCRVRTCCNPDHLQPVTHAENVRRGAAAAQMRMRNSQITHCARGHEFTDDNTLLVRGFRRCRTCNKEQCRRQRAKRQSPHADWSPEQLPQPRQERAS